MEAKSNLYTQAALPTGKDSLVPTEEEAGCDYHAVYH